METANLMLRLSANLGFLWRDRPLIDAVHAASVAGFDAVEFHFPYETDPAALRRALDDTGLALIGLNTRPGAREGDFGLAALPGREREAREAIREALDYARAIRCPAIHVMAGKSGSGREARRTFIGNLAYAAECALEYGITILIEPINIVDVPDYHLSRMSDAAEIVTDLGAGNLVIMADCYHIARMGEPVAETLTRHLDRIGHVQFAAPEDRGPLSADEAAEHAALFSRLVEAGYSRAFGAEYRPSNATDDSLGWMAAFGKQRVPGEKPGFG